MSEEKIVFVGRMQNKTRDYIHNLEKENRQLQQENQQLKEELKLVESLACFNMPNNTPMVCMFKTDYERNKYEYETLDKYKSVLDEIREKIDYYIHYSTSDSSYMSYQQYKEILQILDKVKE